MSVRKLRWSHTSKLPIIERPNERSRHSMYAQHGYRMPDAVDMKRSSRLGDVLSAAYDEGCPHLY